MKTLHLPVVPSHTFLGLNHAPRLFVRPIANVAGFCGVRTNFYPATVPVKRHSLIRWVFSY